MARPGTSCRSKRSHLVDVLGGALDCGAAPVLRKYLLGVVHECAGRLVADLSAVTDADASGLTVLAGLGRRARLPGGSCGLPRRRPKSPSCSA